jgi:hypothetical protein
MLHRFMRWLRDRRERRLFRQMSADINRDRRKMAPLKLPFTSGGRDGEKGL